MGLGMMDDIDHPAGGIRSLTAFCEARMIGMNNSSNKTTKDNVAGEDAFWI